jgi:hypothetical protein
MTRKIKLIYHPNGSNHKLQAVKCVKDLTGLGLRDSKDIVDQIYDNKPMIIESYISDPNKLRESLNQLPPEIKHSTTEELRNINLLSLGLGDEEEYRETLEYYLGFEISNPNIIKEIVSVLTKEQMVYISKIIKEEFYG